MSKHLLQLPLSLSLQDDATFANFLPGDNLEIVEELKKTAAGEGEKLIYLHGTGSQGLSHLLQACCHYAHQHERSSVYLPLAALISLSPEILVGLETLSLLCLDDLQIIAGNKAWEEAVFHLYNRVYDAGGCIIIAANHMPKHLGIRLADLASRLSWGVVYHLHSLTDDEKRRVLTMRAERRGIELPEEISKYLLTHCERDLNTLLSVLNSLDNASLSAKRRLTIPFVKEILKI